MEQIDFKPLIQNVHAFSKAGGVTIRKYQTPAVDAIVDSVLNQKGLHFVVEYPRQSGKNEIQAQMENYLLFRFMKTGGQIVKISPTWKPQSINAKQRFSRVAKANQITQGFVQPSQGYQFLMGNEKTKILFLSGERNSNIVGNTADLLLEIDEAQDIDKTKFDKEIAPMAASTAATIVFYGTAWTNETLLHRERKFCEQQEREDGIKRVFLLTCEDVFPEVPSYKTFVMGEIAKMGRNHPTIKTQYFSEEIDAESSFIQDARTLMAGNHEKNEEPEDGCIFVILIDVAGGEEENKVGIKLETDESQKRDATAITICKLDLSSLTGPKHGITWQVQCRYNWTGLRQVEQYARIEGLINKWQPYVCIDGTGTGMGLSAFIRQLVPEEKFINFVFTMASKSKMGWEWLGMVQTGRWKEYTPGDALQERFFEQIKFCKYEVLPGPGNLIRFSVPDGTRNENNEYIHDDLIMSAAMSAVVEERIGTNFIVPADTLIVDGIDPLETLESRW